MLFRVECHDAFSVVLCVVIAVVVDMVDVGFLNPLFPFSLVFNISILIIVYIPSPVIDVEDSIRLIRIHVEKTLPCSQYVFLSII